MPALYKEIGEAFSRLDSWSEYVITGYEDAERCIGKKAAKNRKIYNGMYENLLLHVPRTQAAPQAGVKGGDVIKKLENFLRSLILMLTAVLICQIYSPRASKNGQWNLQESGRRAAPRKRRWLMKPREVMVRCRKGMTAGMWDVRLQ